MALADTLLRVQELQGLLTRPIAPPTTTVGGAAFSAVLGAQVAPPAVTTPLGGSPGQRLAQAAAAEVGQAEQPPGSNDSARIAEYRTATTGSGVGPWCAYFASWAASQAGVPLGEQGQGFGAVAAIDDWARRTGKLVAPGAPPQPGDLILWGGRHMGIVEAVDPDGSVRTIEGNSSDAVTRRTYGPDGGGATAYVRVG